MSTVDWEERCLGAEAEVERLRAALSAVLWQTDSYLTRARAELMPGVGLELCETALNHIHDTAQPHAQP